jgi:hypothetical protein
VVVEVPLATIVLGDSERLIAVAGPTACAAPANANALASVASPAKQITNSAHVPLRPPGAETIQKPRLKVATTPRKSITATPTVDDRRLFRRMFYASRPRSGGQSGCWLAAGGYQPPPLTMVPPVPVGAVGVVLVGCVMVVVNDPLLP